MHGTPRFAGHKIELTTKSPIVFAHTPYPMLIGPRREKTCLLRFANNTGADQPVHPRSLISAFVIRLLESSIFKLASSKISMIYLVSEAEKTGLSLGSPDTPKTDFVATRPN